MICYILTLFVLLILLYPYEYVHIITKTCTPELENNNIIKQLYNNDRKILKKGNTIFVVQYKITTLVLTERFNFKVSTINTI